jgi:alkanesulfonate monooxygenase SsuD/methylene tetrahydromethanopterin reductase-like flavin-dependent oxidoreductase (luciferase family)
LFVVGSTDAELARRLDRVAGFSASFVPSGTPRTAEGLRELGWLYGRPAEVVEQIRALEAEGVQRVMLQRMELVDEEEIELIAAEVLPHLG